MKSAPTFGSWAITTTARRTKRRPTPRPAGNSSLIDVDILGHIFEQSITDLEKLRNELDGLARARSSAREATRAGARRKARSTPRRLSPATSSNRRWAGCSGTDSSNSGNPTRRRQRARHAPPWPIRRVYDLDKLKKPERAALVRFWEAWQDELAAHSAAGPGLRQRGLPDRSLRPVARGLSGVE